MPSPSSPNAIQGRLPQPSPVRPTSHESLCQRWPPYLPAIGRLVAGFRRAKCHHLVRRSTLVSSPNVTMEQKLFSFLNSLQWIEASEVISKPKRISSRRSRYFFPAAERLQRPYRPAPAPGKLHSQLARLFERLPFNSADRGLCRRPAAVGPDHGRERKFVGPDHRWKDGGARGAPVPVMINERAALRDQAAAGSPLLNFTGIFR